MSLEAMKQALAALENSRSYVEFDWVKNQCGRAITALSAAIDEAQPDARAHHKMMVAMTTEHWRRIDPQWKNDPELCHALGYEAGYNDAVAPRVEPRASGSGAGFESLPASPTMEQKT